MDLRRNYAEQTRALEPGPGRKRSFWDYVATTLLTAAVIFFCWRWVEYVTLGTASSVLVSPGNRTIGVLGVSSELRAHVRTRTGAILAGATVNWESDAAQIATVDSAGRVTAVRPGRARVIASFGAVSDTAVIEVRDIARLSWRFQTGGRITGGVALTRDNSVLVGSLGPSNTFYALRADGNLEWQLPLITYGAPAIAGDDVMYVGTADGTLVSLSHTGEVIWTRQLGSKISASPVCSSDGTIYVATADGVLYAIASSGETTWRFQADGGFGLSAPAVNDRGTVYVGGLDGNVYALNPDGSLAWKFGTGGGVQASPTVGTDGTVFVGSSDGRLYAIRPDGNERWSFAAEREIWAEAALDGDGRVLVGSVDRHLYAINADDGHLLWSFAAQGRIVSGPVIGPAGSAYVADTDGRIYALSRDGSLRWDFPTGGLVQGTPAIGRDGTLYVASYDGFVYALTEVAAGTVDEHGDHAAAVPSVTLATPGSREARPPP